MLYIEIRAATSNDKYIIAAQGRRKLANGFGGREDVQHLSEEGVINHSICMQILREVNLYISGRSIIHEFRCHRIRQCRQCSKPN